MADSQSQPSLGDAWNSFWFAPGDPLIPSAVRLIAGAAALYFLASYSFDLTAWFSAEGMLPVRVVANVAGATRGLGAALNVLSYVQSPLGLWMLHVLGLLTAAACLLGLGGRFTTAGSLYFVLCYMHRAPMLTGQFGPVLAMLLLYLCIAPCTENLSLDSLLRRRSFLGPPATASWLATLAVRLIQIHLCGFYLMMALTKLTGPVWVQGVAMWTLTAQPYSRVVDLTFGARESLVMLVNLWTHAVVLVELLLPAMVWNRWTRTPILIASAVLWLTIALATGLLSYCLLMIAANLIFLPTETWQSVLRGTAREETSRVAA